MISDLTDQLKQIIVSQFGVSVVPVLTRTDEQFGDFASNIAMQLAKELGQNPREIAQTIVSELQNNESIISADVAGPGFINIRLKDGYIYDNSEIPKLNIAQTILLEYSCPNAFKELHTGHLYQTLIGDSMGRVYEFTGAKVIRTSFGGDVGLHAAKCLWGILKALGGENPGLLDEITDRSFWVSAAYVAGSAAYEEDLEAKNEINVINKKIYELFTSETNEQSAFARIYFTVRQWSYDYFDQFYESISVRSFDAYYPESQTMEPGLAIVRAHPEVFTASEGAIVLDESKTGLHTRVFITSAGLPTYETKDLGVISLETEQFDYDRRVIMTGNDQSEYMKVVFKALELVNPELAAKQHHVANGTVKFAGGQKMSSRLGNVSKATDVLIGVEQAITHEDPVIRRQIALGAVKYSMLKSRVGGDIAFDLEQSISTEGNSGPYLQYALVRARSILRKAESNEAQNADIPEQLDKYERRLVLKITEFTEVINITIADFSPHHICGYLYELATTFNQFYENSRVIGDPRSALRLDLVNKYEQTLKTGLDLLGIPAPEEM